VSRHGRRSGIWGRRGGGKSSQPRGKTSVHPRTTRRRTVSTESPNEKEKTTRGWAKEESKRSLGGLSLEMLKTRSKRNKK